ncbi:MAG: hypothetical protein ABIF71_10055 [Planctomycetota bacterium]
MQPVIGDSLQPILAGGGGGGVIIFLIFVAFSIISAVAESRKKKRLQEEKARSQSSSSGRRPAPAAETGRTKPASIEDFLRELSRQSQTPSRPAAPPAEEAAEETAEPAAYEGRWLIEAERQLRNEQRRPHQDERRKAAGAAPEDADARILAHQRKLQDAIRRRAAAQSAEAPAAVKVPKPASQPATVTADAASDDRGLRLHKPADLRQVIVLREVLSRPLALRGPGEDQPW